MTHPELSEHEDYPPLPRSPRHVQADRIAAFLHARGLSRQEEPRRETGRVGGTWYEVAFAARLGSGCVRVYSEDYVFVGYSYAAAGGDWHTRIFGGGEDALAFILLTFEDGDLGSAAAVPQRVSKRRGG